MTKIDSDKLHLVDIKIIESSIVNKLELTDCSQIVLGYNIQIGVENSVDPEQKILKESFTIVLQAQDKEGKNLDLSGRYNIDLLFKVDNLDDFIKKENDQFIVDNELGITLISIAYSTCRGIVYAHSSGTALKGIVLPVVKPGNIMQESELKNN